MLLGEICCLRRPEREDFSIIWKWLNNPVSGKMMALDFFPPNFDSIEILYNKNLFDPHTENFMVHAFDRNTIGTIDLYEISWKDKWASINIMIGEKEYRDKGYEKDSLGILIEFSFNEINLKRLEVKIPQFDEVLIKCSEQLGFQREGTLRKKILYNGKYYDQYIMGLLKEDLKL